MPNIKRYGSQRSLAIGFAVAGLGAVLAAQTAAAQPAAAQAQTRNTSGSVRQDNLAAESVTVHHYASPADRARDALLIVEAKTAIAMRAWPTTIRSPSMRTTAGLRSPVCSHRSKTCGERSRWWPALTE